MLQIKISKSDHLPQLQQGFIPKLKRMLLDQNFKQIIHILESNDGFIILNIQKFLDQSLPQYFKHSNYHSFRRQLNYYGFKCLNKEKNSVEYFNKQFNIHSDTQIKKNIKQPSEADDFASQMYKLEELRQNQQILLKQIEDIKIIQEKIRKNIQNNMIKYLQSQIRSEFRRQNMQKFCVRFYKSINDKYFKQFFDKNFLNAAKQTQHAYDDEFFLKHLLQYQPIFNCFNKNQNKDLAISQQNDDLNQFDDKLSVSNFSVSNLSAYFDL